MKTSSWISYGACAAAGVLATLAARSLFFAARTETAAVEMSASMVGAEAPSVSSTPVRLGDRPGPMPAGSQIDVAVLPASSSFPRMPESYMTAYRNAASQYAAFFQPGVVADDAIPEFVAAVYEASGRYPAVLEEHDRYLQEPADAWSASMEGRLIAYLASQPEIATTRVSVSCRTSQCQLQFTEKPAQSAGKPVAGNTLAIYSRLINEPWFKEQFASGIGSGSPTGADIDYMRKTIPRLRK